ncbi:hypothetical protein BJX66DRAFT_320234 [Aspergillus keveii]|uniref:Uncharacterized protein n=1 Tax=Aspergillus keveii TaxID=714993 RepID=A0ABR4FHC8_9EURO
MTLTGSPLSYVSGILCCAIFCPVFHIQVVRSTSLSSKRPLEGKMSHRSPPRKVSPRNQVQWTL